MWDYAPICIGIFGALVVVGIYRKLKNNAVSYFKLLRIALVVAFVLSLFSTLCVPLKSGVVLFWSLIVELVLYEVIVRFGSQIKKSYNKFRINPQYYFKKQLLCVKDFMKPILEALVPRGSWKDIRIGKPVSPGPLQIGLAIVASIVALVFGVMTWVFFFSEEEYLRFPVWTFRYSLLFSAVIITSCYLMVLVFLAALQRFHIMLSPIRFGKSLRCVADWSGYGAALASCLVLALPVIFLVLGIKLNSPNHAFFSLSLLFNAASLGALGGLVIGCFVGLFHLIESRNFVYNSIVPSALFLIFDLVVLYGWLYLRPTVLLDRYLESYLSEDDVVCNSVVDVKSILNECLSWNCERMYVVLKKCDPSVGRLIDSVDVIYFWCVIGILCCIVLCRLVKSIANSRDRTLEDDSTLA